MNKFVVLISLWAFLTAGGCAAGRTGTTPRSRAEQNQAVYELYRQYMAATNQERQEAGLPPMTIRSYEEFRQSPGAD
jgi:uncharacterized protein YkwD